MDISFLIFEESIEDLIPFDSNTYEILRTEYNYNYYVKASERLLEKLNKLKNG